MKLPRSRIIHKEWEDDNLKKQVKIGLGAAELALAAALCAGGTLAGWRTSSTVTNHISTATVQGIVEEKYEQGQTITPGQTVEKCVWVKNTGTASSLVRAKVVIDWDDETAADMDATDCVFPAYNTADWTQGEDGYWYYNDIVEPNQCSTALFESFTVSPNLTNELAGRTGHIGVTMELLQASGDSPTLWGRTWSAYRRTPDAVAAKTQTAHIRFTYDENGGLIEYPDGQLFLDFQNLAPVRPAASWLPSTIQPATIPMPRVRCGFAPHWRTTTNWVQKLRKKSGSCSNNML